MIGTLFYYIVFLLLTAFALIEKSFYDKNKVFIVTAFSAILLILIAGLRGENVARDYVNYLSYLDTFVSFSHYLSNPAYYDFNEPGIFLVAAFMQTFEISNVKFFFVVFAFIAVFIKIKAVIKTSTWIGLTIVLFFTNFFLIQEMTQIRGAIAVAFLLLSIPDIYHRNLYSFLLKVAVSMVFHYSSILIIPLYFLKPDTFSRQINSALLFGCIVLGLLNVTVFTLIDNLNLGVISLKLNKYYELLEAGYYTSINKFNALILLRISIACFAIYYSVQLKEHSKYAYLILKLYILSICSFYFFSTVPAIAFRISEMLGISEIILLPMLIYVVREKSFAVGAVLSFALLNLIIYVQISKLVNPYF